MLGYPPFPSPRLVFLKCKQRLQKTCRYHFLLGGELRDETEGYASLEDIGAAAQDKGESSMSTQDMQMGSSNRDTTPYGVELP